MKVLKFVTMSLIFILTSCSFNIDSEKIDEAKNVFSEHLDKIYEMYENNGKKILADLSVDKAEEMLNGILTQIPDDKKELVYKGIEKGVELVEDGKEILANELSMDVSLEGMQEEIESFLDSLGKIDARITVGNLLIEKTDNAYKLDCTINFFYSSEKQ